MKKICFYVLAGLLLFTSCKKNNSDNRPNNQLYPLTKGNTWIYTDSFFTVAGQYAGKDTFTLKTAKNITYNTKDFTPITDQFDDSIFILRSDDTTVHILEHPGEALFFRNPETNSPPFIISLYNSSTYTSVINTLQFTTTRFPSYKIVITQDDGIPAHFKQQELFFSSGLGIIKGRDIRQTNSGIIYTYDSYTLLSYSLY